MSPPTDLALQRPGSQRQGTVALPALTNGFGFIDPDDGGRQVLMRASRIDGNRALCAGDAVLYWLGTGTLGLEAVQVRLLGGATH